MKPICRSAFVPAWLVGLVFCLSAVAAGFAKTTVTDLRCEGLDNPLGIDATKPRLSWILNSDERGQRQTAHQILVASSVEKLKADQGDLWDSGKVNSDRSIQENYAGKSLTSNEQCFWKVCVWDKDGNVSDWSEPALWTMGLFFKPGSPPSPSGFGAARWIGLDGENVRNHLTNTW